MKNLLVIFIAASVFAGCKNQEATTTSTTKPGEENLKKPKANQPDKYCGDLFEKLSATKDFVKVNITQQTISDGCLCVTFTYSGCARSEDYAALFDGDFNPEARPQVNIDVFTLSTGECEQLITDSACFSLKRLQLIGNEVLVSVNNGNQELLYTAPSID